MRSRPPPTKESTSQTMRPIRDTHQIVDLAELTAHEEAVRLEYMTGAILGAMTILAAFSLFASAIGLWAGNVTPEITIILSAAFLVFAGSWIANRKGYWKTVRYIPVAVLFLISVHGSVNGGGNASLALVYVVTIVLAAVLLGASAQIVVVLLSLCSYVSFALLHHAGVLTVVRSDDAAFTNRLLIVVSSFLSLAILLRFLVRQLSAQADAILRARTTISRSETEYQTLFDAIGEGVFISDPSGTIVNVNPAACAQVGFTRGEIIGKNAAEISARAMEETSRMLERLSRERVLRYATVHRKKDGTTVPVDLTLTSIEVDGTPRVLAIARDTSERSNSERALRESEEKFRLMFDLAPYGFTLTDREGRIEMASRTILDKIGKPAEAITGMTMAQLGIIAPDLERTLIERLAGSGSIDKAELTITEPDGSTVDLLCSSVRITLGKDVHYLTAVLNISERKQAERLLAESEQKYRTLFEEAGDAILLMDDATILDCNAKAVTLFGRTRDMIIGHSPAELSPATQPNGLPSPRRARELIDAAVGGRQQSFEWIHTRGDGTSFYAEVSLIRLTVHAGRMLLAIVRDISVQKEAAAVMERARLAAEESSRAKSTLLLNLSHEFRTPLTGILGLSEVIGREAQDEALKHQIEGIAASGRRLLSTLESILTLARLSSGDVEIATGPVDVGPILSRVIDRFRPVAEEKGISLSSEHGTEHCVVHAEEDALFTILSFLLDNAVKFTSFGSVSVGLHAVTEDSTNRCCIRVHDSGIGIPAEKHETIFEEFRQVSEGTSRSFEGTGLGLTVARRMARLLGGDLTVSSTPGEGSTFSLWLRPAEIVPPVSLLEDRPVFAPTETGTGPLDVLIVEDNFINKAVMADALKSICRTEHARNGPTAIRMAREKNYHAILMDINLGAPPDGIQTTQEIRRLPGYEAIPIIAVTGYTLPDEREALMSRGLSMYLPKPFVQAELQQIVRRALFG